MGKNALAMCGFILQVADMLYGFHIANFGYPSTCCYLNTSKSSLKMRPQFNPSDPLNLIIVILCIYWK